MRLAKLQIPSDAELSLEEVHRAVELAMRQAVTREELVEWLSKVAKSHLPWTKGTGQPSVLHSLCTIVRLNMNTSPVALLLQSIQSYTIVSAL